MMKAKQIYKTHNILCIDFSPDFQVYECYKNEEGVFFSANAENLPYEDIPLLIEYLQKVLSAKHERNLKRNPA